MITIKVLKAVTLADFHYVATGYRTDKQYVVTYVEKEGRVCFDLQPVTLDKPFSKEWTFEAETVERYEAILEAGYSFAAYDDDLLVGLAIAEAHEWNQSVWVWEFHVAEAYRRQGIGRRLMDCVAERAKAADMRILVCETQNTNSNGIDVYRQLGFRLEGVDISYYTNSDYPDGEVAVFMKRRLD